MQDAIMEQDLHPERPRPVTKSRTASRVKARSVALCIGLPVAAVDAFAVSVLGLPLFDTVAFGVCAVALATYGILQEDGAPRLTEGGAKILWIVAAIMACALFLWLSSAVAAGFAALAAVALATGVCAAYWGIGACRNWASSLALLAFAVPWLDPESTYLSHPWRSILAQIVGAVAGLVAGPVQIQGTSVSAGSIKLALASDVGGFWQIQIFLLTALGLAMSSNWGPARRLLWLGAALILGALAYTAFLVSFFIIHVLAAGNLPAIAGIGIELFWWAAAFLALMRAAKPRESATAVTDPSGNDRSETMFPDEVKTS
jgi:hypothetical protein